MGIIRLRVELKALRHAINELGTAIEKYSETIRTSKEDDRNKPSATQSVQAVVAFDDKTVRDAKTENDRQYRVQNSIRWAAWLAFVAATIYAFVAAKQLREMRKTTKAEQGQLALLRDADRPWIDIDISITSPLTYNGKVVQGSFTFVPTNIGRSPAENISINPILKPVFMFDNLQEVQKRLCDNAATESGSPFFLKYALFPGHHYNQPIGLEVSIEDINSHSGKLPPDLRAPDPIPIALVGCVDYTYELSDHHHQTAFAFNLVMKDGGATPLKSKTPIPAGSLGLRTHPTKGDYPN